MLKLLIVTVIVSTVAIVLGLTCGLNLGRFIFSRTRLGSKLK